VGEGDTLGAGGREGLVDSYGICGRAPLEPQCSDVQTVPLRDLGPPLAERPYLNDEDLVARGVHVGDGGLHAPRP